MARPAYSALLASATSVSAPTDLGGPPEGYLWVLRDAFMTFGFYAAFFRGGVSVGGVDPWLWLFRTSSDALFGVAHSTLEWHGRIVIPPGATLWAKTDTGTDVADFYFSGYVLSASGSY